jgi:phage baseplate assembly protein W|tara:strand:+ start:488 stop:883 length:396 start_codon:yes stop_codon:yes gene_type:complete
MPEIREPVYKDIPISFTAHPITGKIKSLINRDAVKQSVKNIVLTNFYERPYNPILGGDVLAKLFENMGPLTEYEISNNIREALDNFEPRAEVDEIKVDALEDQNALNVTITFRVINDVEPISVTVFLERVR